MSKIKVTQHADSVDVGLMLNNLFSKHGMGDGDWLYATHVQDLFEKFLRYRLQSTDYEFERLGSVHNKRIHAVKIRGNWYLTELLPWTQDDEDWRLSVPEDIDNSTQPKEPEESILCPDDLKQAILEFLPIADYLCYHAPGSQEGTDAQKSE